MSAEAPPPADLAVTADDDERRYRRREVIVTGGVLTAASLLSYREWERGLQQLFAPGDGLGTIVSLVRPEDQLSLDLLLVNLKVVGGPPRLVRINGSKDAFVVVGFPPQAIAEEAIVEAGPQLPLPNPPYDSRLAGPSRLAFFVPTNLKEIPFTDASLLDWRLLSPSLAPNANDTTGAKPQPKKPSTTETAIEYPWRMVISPVSKTNYWAHSATPVARDGRAELWHTRMGAIGEGGAISDTGPVYQRRVRAIWTPDREVGPTPQALTPDDRQNIVEQTSNWKKHKVPKAIDAHRLMLSSLGAWADLSVDFPEGLPVAHYSDLGTMGRQHFVKVVTRYFLFPFGHEASLVTITERKIGKLASTGGAGSEGNGRPVAAMRRRQFVVVTEPVKNYDDRDFPFKSVEILTKVTPNLEPVGKGSSAFELTKDGAAGSFGDAAFWPVAGEGRFLFSVVARDNGGIPSTFSTPLVLVSLNLGKSTSGSKQLKDIFEQGKYEGERTRPLGGQSVAYAPPSPGKSRDTAYDTDDFELGVELTNPNNNELPKFRPSMAGARIRVPALEAVAAAKSGAKATAAAARVARGERVERRAPEDDLKNAAGTMLVEPAKAFVEGVENKAELFLQAKKAEALQYVSDAAGEVAGELAEAAGDLTGALGVPNMDIVGLSKTLGPIGGKVLAGGIPDLKDLEDLATFKPADFLKGAKFLGIDFAKVLEDAIPLPSPQDVASDAVKALKVPKYITETVYETVEDIKEAKEEIEGAAQDAEKALEDAKEEFEKAKTDLENQIPKEIRTQFDWSPDLTETVDDKGNPKTPFLAKDNTGKAAKMKMHGLTVVPINFDVENPQAASLGTPQAEVSAELTNFGIALFDPVNPYIEIYFSRLSFEAKPGQKPDVDVALADVQFKRELSFINELRTLMSTRKPQTTAGDVPDKYSAAGNGFAIDVTPAGVNASYGLEIPTITLGVFTMANMSIGARFAVPFTGEPVSAGFNFCTPSKPFLLTYTIFGGGGYADITATAKGLQTMNVSLEFGAATAMNFGVASGSVQVMAGITFAMNLTDENDPKIKLGGFVRLHGHLSVLGLVKLSLDFNLILQWDPVQEEAWGSATLTVKVEVLCFSESVSVTATKRFAGSGGGAAAAGTAGAQLLAAGDRAPVSFAALYDPSHWRGSAGGTDADGTRSDGYVDAFAGAAFTEAALQ